MFSLIAALAAAAQQPVRPVDDPDFRCMVVMSLVIDQISKDSKADPEEKAGVTGIFMYYLGKIDTRFPQLDDAMEVTALVEQPGYVETKLRPDVARCAAEATERGRTLEELGKALEDRAPRTETKPG